MAFFYPPSLPITSYLEKISDLIREHQVVIIAGETGSGKTTQLPKLCLEVFSELTGIIGCTQPRRIAATTVAERVGEEMGASGSLVGSKIRFHDNTDVDTRIKFMTDGILLAETRHDPLLTKYDIVIVDEAHERSLNIDFLLGYLHRLIKRRPELKLIITSATIDTQAFSRHFSNAPILQIEGRTYPIDILYESDESEEVESSYLEHCIEVLSNICLTKPPGDILVFLPTEKDIRSCCEILRGRIMTHEVLPLFGKLQAKDQKRIFKPLNKSKIVVATNVAETSVTVPGIRYVVDSGLARIGSYHPRSRTMRLPIAKISQASANQRTGRSGRIGPGICVRLYTEDDFVNRPEFSTPEIQRSNLAEVILQMVALKLGDPYDFPFLNPPKRTAIRDGYKTLIELGAISDKNKLTEYGRIMSGLPIDPIISRIIIEAQKCNCLKEIVVIAAALAIQDPRIRPAEKEKLADKTHQNFADPRSDFMALLTIWNRYHESYNGFSWSGLKKFCTVNYLSFQRMREWLDLHEQLCRLLKRKNKFTFNTEPASYEAVHRSLLTGLFRQCARKKKGPVYQGLGNRELMIFPGSYQYAKNPDWIVAGSIIETSQLFALTVAAIEPEWLEQCAKDFCSYSWANSRYHKKTGRIMAAETVALQGLIIISSRQVNYPLRDKKNRAPARDIFIQKALVEHNLHGQFDFYTRNNALLSKWQEREHTLRKRDIVINDPAIFDFYDNRLPKEVYDRPSLIKHLKRTGDKTLHMTEADILLRSPGDKDLLDFPAFLPHTRKQVKLRYNFDPGSEHDGVTAYLPEQEVDAIDHNLFDWLVPGLLVEKTTYLFKGLPKKLRKQIIPINNSVDLVLDSLELYQGNLLQQLTSSLFKLFRVTIHPDDWPNELPTHLNMHYQLVDSSGKTLMSGHDLNTLLNRFQTSPGNERKTFLQPRDSKLVNELQEKIFTTWEFDTYPERLGVYLENNQIGGYLYGALQPVPEKRGVTLKYFSSRKEAEEIGLTGLCYLIRLQFNPPVKQLSKYCRVTLSGPSAIWLCSMLGNTAQTCDLLIDFIFKSIIGLIPQPLVDSNQFHSMIAKVAEIDLYAYGKSAIDRILELLRLRREVLELISKYEGLSRKSGSLDEELYSDLHIQLDQILPANFLDAFTYDELENRTRYLRSLAIRCERAYSNPQKDLQKRNKLSSHQKNIARYQEKHVHMDDVCRDKFRGYKQLIDELRISLFSPEIKTRVPVSEKKVAAVWKDLSHSC